MIYIGPKIRKERIYINDEKSRYLVCETGEIYSEINNIILKGGLDEDGYRIHSLYTRDGKKHTLKAHRLVASAFVPNPDNLPEVNHINGKKYINFYKNLEWITSVENTHHACDTGLRHTILSQNVVRYICEDLQNGDIRADEISKKYEVPISSIIKIKNGVNWKSISKDYDFSNYKFTRGLQGSRNNNSKISEIDVHRICALLRDGKSPTEIGIKLAINRSIIYRIKNKITWTDISKNYLDESISIGFND